jgi:hypothetical protein
MDTAANTMKPLYQLIALAKMRPDCIWDGTEKKMQMIGV